MNREINNLLVIADDLTGANDTGVMFAEKGFSTILKTNISTLNNIDLSQANIFTVSTDARALHQNAEEVTYKVVSSAIDNGITQLYLKIDSTMRGSVPYQIDGALSAWKKLYPKAKVIICPAYPEMGRTIENGILYVSGIPVQKTASGQDVICPVHSSVMTDLLPKAEQISFVSETDLLEKIKSSSSDQFVIDAKTEDDLNIISKIIWSLGRNIIPVGSAGLADKLVPKLQHYLNNKEMLGKGRSLILVTSIHETSQNQVDEYIASINGGKAIVFNPSPSQLLNHKVSKKALIDQLDALISSSEENVIIRANPIKVVNSGVDINVIAKTLAVDLADLGFYCLEHKHFDNLILFGGDGAATILDKMNVTEMKILYSIVAGVPVCKIQNGKYANLTVITKSGGFGNCSLLISIMEKN